MLNENVVKLLKSSMWDLATCANGESNVVPVIKYQVYKYKKSYIKMYNYSAA